jgi:hypothetical protein
MIRNRLSRDRRHVRSFVLACLLAAFTTGTAGEAAASSTSKEAAAQQPAPPVRKAGLLPPAIVLFDNRGGAGIEPMPDAAGSSVAAEAVGAAFVAELAARKIELTVIGEDELGPVDLSRLYAVPRRLASGEMQPLPEAALMVAYPPGTVEKAMDQHRLDAAWIITGIAILSKGSAGTSGPATSPTEAPGAGERLLLRAALVDKEGKILFSDVVGAGAVAPVERMLGALAEFVPTRVDPRDPEAARRQVKALLAEYRTEEDRSEAERAATRAQEARAAAPKSPHPAGFRLGLGVFFIAGVDLWAGFVPKNSRWQFGYRYVWWTDTFYDPYTGRQLTDTREAMQGPQVNYLFRPEKRGSWYVGASVLQWSRTEAATMNGVSNSDSVVNPYFGGGYTRGLGKHVYVNAAIFLAPWASLGTNTGVSSEESSGGFDIQLQLGAAF